MYKSEPDYVTGRRGRLDLYPWVTHPAFCVCGLCVTHRPRAAAKSGKSIDEVWSTPLDVRIRRDSPYPNNRKLSAAAALLLKAEEEKRLTEALAAADAQRRARQNAVNFGHVVDAYRRYLNTNGKAYRGALALIENIEWFIGTNRDVAAVDFAIYRELLAEVSLMSAETRRHYASTLLAILNHAKAERVIPTHQLEGVRVRGFRTMTSRSPGPLMKWPSCSALRWTNTSASKPPGMRGLLRTRQIAASVRRPPFRYAASASWRI